MALSDRLRLRERALALPRADASDFFGERRPPPDADPSLLRRIDDTNLRTKLIETRLAEGLQSPKGPQKIASIVRIYPDFDAPAPRATATVQRPVAPRGLPTVDEMARLIDRIRATEADVSRELSQRVDERIEHLKRSLPGADGEELIRLHAELGEALDERRALAGQIRYETFRRIEHDATFAPRAFLRYLQR